MDHRLQIFHRSTVALLIVVSAGVFMWLLAKDFVVTGVLDVTYDFSKPSPFITRLTSEDKVDPIEYGESDATQRMRKDPVGFTVRLPRAFHRMTAELVYRMDRDQPLNIGVQVKRGIWSPYLLPVQSVRKENGWTIGRVVFSDLARFDFSGNMYQLILNAPEMREENDNIQFSSIRIIAERDPWTFSTFIPRLWHYIKK